MRRRTISSRRLTGGCAVVVLALAVSPASADAGRFAGHVSGAASGPGHAFVVGDGLNLVFRDASRSGTRYRVCWTRGAGQRCWTRTTGRAGRRSTIFTAAPGGVGNYATTWRVGGRVVARWSFYNGVGD